MESTVQYLKKKHINLSQSEILELFDDREGNQELIARSQFAMVMKLSQKFAYLNPSKTLDEIISDALYALNDSIRYYDITKGTDFSLFTHVKIHQLVSHFRYDNNIIKPSVKAKKGLLDETDVKVYVNKFEDYNEDGDFLAVYNPIDEETKPQVNHTELCKVLRDILKPKHSEILIASLGICGRNDKLTLEEIGEMYGTTKQNINQIKMSAIAKLRSNDRFIKYLKEINNIL